MNKSLKAFRKAAGVYALIERTPELQWLPYCYVTETTSPMNDYTNLKKALFGLRLTQALIWVSILVLLVSSIIAIAKSTMFKTDNIGFSMTLIINALIILLCFSTSCLFYVWWIDLREAFIEKNWKNVSFADDVLKLDNECGNIGDAPKQPLKALWAEPESLKAPLHVIDICHRRNNSIIRDILTADIGGAGPATALAKKHLKERFERHVRLGLYTEDTILDTLYRKVKASAKKYRSLVVDEPKDEPEKGSSKRIDTMF